MVETSSSSGGGEYRELQEFTCLKPEWLPKIGVPVADLAELMRQAKLNHDDRPEIGGHNFMHAEDTAFYALSHAEQLEAEGRDINWKVLFFGALFHDARYTENAAALGYASKEEHAGVTFGRLAPSNLFSKEEVGEIIALIASTHPDAPLKTLEQRILFLADLATLDKDWHTFERKSKILRAEARFLTDTAFDSAAYTAANIDGLARYILKGRAANDVITPEWVKLSTNNLRLLVTKASHEEGVAPQQYLAALPGPAASRLLDRFFGNNLSTEAA